VGVDHLLSKE